MTKQKRITQADRLVVYVSHHPGITTPEVCDAFNSDSGSTGQQLAALVQRGVMTRPQPQRHPLGIYRCARQRYPRYRVTGTWSESRSGSSTGGA